MTTAFLGNEKDVACIVGGKMGMMRGRGEDLGEAI